MMNFALARTNMVNCQLSTNGIIESAVLEAFDSIPREVFLPEKYQNLAYIDEDLKLDNGGMLMEPLILARLVQAAEVKPDDIVLNIGDTTGFSSAVLSRMASTVVALESKIGILDRARKVWAGMDLCNIAVLKGDNRKGSAQHGPYTLIILNGSVSEIPDSLTAQLADSGRLVTVLRKPGQTVGQITVLKKLNDQGFSTVRLSDAATPYLQEFEPVSGFTF